jgi:ACS family glucarate transporter-like MFS transporter
MSVCLDIGGKFSGAVTGAMNTVVYLCAFASSVIYGYLVNNFGNYEVPFIPMIVFMVAGTLVALLVDAEQKVVPGA